jgi:hypothetical protein
MSSPMYVKTAFGHSVGTVWAQSLLGENGNFVSH